MIIESKWERDKRLKNQRRANRLTLVIVVALVVVLSVVVFSGKSALAAKNADYEAQIEKLSEQIEAQQERKEELEEYSKYVQTKKFYEETAKNKFGLIYPDEILVKPKE